MGDIIDIVLPVFLLIAIGYAAARSGFLSESTGDGVADYVFKLAVPVLLMRSLATASFEASNPWYYWGSYFFGVIIVWLGATVVIAGVFKRGYRASVIAGVAAGFSNLVLMGIPLAERAYGEQGLQVLFLLISIHLPVMMAISTFLMEHAVRADGVEKSALNPVGIATSLLRNLAVNPIIIGILVGFIWRLSGVGVGGIAAQIMDLIARTTGPLALIALGMGLIKYDIKGNIMPAIALSALSLLVMPFVVYLIGTHVFPLPPLWLKVAVMAAACPTGVNAYLFANYFKIAEGLATNTIVIALLGSLITLPFWLGFVG